jgi:hypothetical protein
MGAHATLPFAAVSPWVVPPNKRVRNHYYASASRYTTSAFMRLRLGSGLSERNLKPQVFETRAEAHAFASRGASGE